MKKLKADSEIAKLTIEGGEMNQSNWGGLLRVNLLAWALSSTLVSKTFIDPALRLRLRANSPEYVSAVLHFPGQANLDSLRLDSLPPNERGPELAKALIDFNREKSEAVRLFLQNQDTGLVQETSPIWITNSLRVKAAPAIIEKITKMNAIDSIYLNSPKQIDDPIEGGASLATSVDTEPEIMWGIKKLNADKVWAKGFQGQGVTVAMIDSGATIKHPDLAPNIWVNRAETGLDNAGVARDNNGKDDDGNGFVDDVNGWDFENNSADVSDNGGHGSQTAGIVGGMGAGGKQTGVAPKAKLMILKACCNAGSTELFESNIWLAYQYVIQQGVRAISMSLSAKHNTDPNYAKWRRASEVLLAAGVIHINSAGNRGSANAPFNIGAPASNPPAWLHPSQPITGGLTSMITIGATGENDEIRYYSSTGPVTWEAIEGYKDYAYSGGTKQGLVKPDVCGPSEVPSTSMDGTSYTVSFGGTSSATPHIGGVMALLLSAKPTLTPVQAIRALQETAVPVENGFNNKCGAGRVDALAALEYVLHKLP